MNQLQIFENPKFGNIRTITEGSKTLFCGKDVAAALGYKRPADAITAHCKGSVIRRLPTSGGEQDVKFIPEGDIYRLAARSELPGADEFERWIFDEVLPSIRRTGGYIAGADSMPPEELMAKALLVAQKTIEAQKEQLTFAHAENQAMRPKALFADAVAASKSAILVGEMAKLLKQNGVEIGQNRFFQWLRDNGYLIRRKGSDYNMPSQQSMELDLFEIKETSISHADGHVSISRTPKVTGKGQLYFVQRFMEQERIAREEPGA